MRPAWKLASALALLSAGCRDGAAPNLPERTVVAQCTFDQSFRAAWKEAFEKANPPWKLDFTADRVPLPAILQTHGDLRELLASGGIQPLPQPFYERFGVSGPLYLGREYVAGGVRLPLGMAANAALCEGAHIENPPQTWAGFIEDLDRLKALGIAPVAFEDGNPSRLLSYLLQTSLYPGSFVPSWTQDRNRRRVRFAQDPEAKAGLKAFVGFAGRFVTKNPLDDRSFLSGKSAICLAGPELGRRIDNVKAEYWPVPSLLGRHPKFIASNLQDGWAISSRVAGDAAHEAERALEALYDPQVYQRLLDAESALGSASKIRAMAPQSDSRLVQHFYNSLAENFGRYESLVGQGVAPDDQWPPGFETALDRVSRRVLEGDCDIHALLQLLDSSWDELSRPGARSASSFRSQRSPRRSEPAPQSGPADTGFRVIILSCFWKGKKGSS